MSWIGFIAIIAAFFVTHSIPVRPAVKSQLVVILGPRGFTFMYSFLSLAMLWLLIWAAGQAPFVPLWDVAVWQKYVTLVGMFAVCLLLAVSIGRPNPFSFGGAKNDQFDSKRPGIVGWARHPLLVALALWAGLHLVPNGDLAHIILFGVFLGFALLGQKIIDARKQRAVGSGIWQALVSEVKTAPLLQSPVSFRHLALRLFGGVFVYMGLILIHPWLLGVSPLP